MSIELTPCRRCSAGKGKKGGVVKNDNSSKVDTKKSFERGKKMFEKSGACANM